VAAASVLAIKLASFRKMALKSHQVLLLFLSAKK